MFNITVKTLIKSFNILTFLLKIFIEKLEVIATKILEKLINSNNLTQDANLFLVVDILIF